MQISRTQLESLENLGELLRTYYLAKERKQQGKLILNICAAIRGQPAPYALNPDLTDSVPPEEGTPAQEP